MARDPESRRQASAREPAERAVGRTRAARVIDAFSERERMSSPDERDWKAGADGEDEVARVMAARCPAVPVLHDRRLAGSGTNIDHIAIAPSGVYVIDTKRCAGKVEVINPLLGKPRLIVGGRNHTRLVDALAKQVRAVRGLLADDVPVYGCFCFVNTPSRLARPALPTLWTLRIADFRLYAPRRLARQLNQPGPLTRPDAAAIVRALEDASVPA